jgi:hypothetical protein
MAKLRKSKGKGGRIPVVIIAVLVLLAAIGVAIYKLHRQHEAFRLCSQKSRLIS